MSSIRPLDMQMVVQEFERKGDPGYVLDFSGRTFRDFFALKLSLDLDDLAMAPGQAFTLGLVLNELLACLAENGAPPGPWSLAFGLHASGPGAVVLTVTESLGVWSRLVRASGQSSLGLDLVSALAAYMTSVHQINFAVGRQVLQ